MSLSQDVLRRMASVAYEREMGFVELVGLAELDPAVAFRRANLRGVSMRGQDLSGFDFTGASMERCDIRGADLSRTLGVTRGMFESCVHDAGTQVPRAWFWASGRLPVWAKQIGTDDFGTYADIAIPTGKSRIVTQRLRLVQSGRFLMGSPVDEPGRWSDEGPQHEVTIQQGFWLFDSPCTQQLWRAVMGKNPGAFKSPTRPVEQVSYTDVLTFLDTVNGRMEGLNLILPSEAQWEYACRAGTVDATYAGPIEILGQYNASALDAIAWYGGNSGQNFDLKNGFDSSGWKDQHYPNTRAGTRIVKQKEPNKWGLYDMLGNVWEWCADEWHGTYDGAPEDGSAWAAVRDGAANRVLRGGSWARGARDVRAASRSINSPSGRSGNVGFRCARVQEPV